MNRTLLHLFATALFGFSTGALAAPLFEESLSGAQEVPPVESAGTGQFALEFSDDLSQAQYRLQAAGTTTAFVGAHLHCAGAGENGPIVVELTLPTEAGVTGTITNADIIPPGPEETTCGRVINNLASLLAAIRDDAIYVNVHTEANPPGELRAQIFPRTPDLSELLPIE